MASSSRSENRRALLHRGCRFRHSPCPRSRCAGDDERRRVQSVERSRARSGGLEIFLPDEQHASGVALVDVPAAVRWERSGEHVHTERREQFGRKPIAAVSVPVVARHPRARMLSAVSRFGSSAYCRQDSKTIDRYWAIGSRTPAITKGLRGGAAPARVPARIARFAAIRVRSQWAWARCVCQTWIWGCAPNRATSTSISASPFGLRQWMWAVRWLRWRRDGRGSR